MSTQEITYRRVWAVAWPMILASSSTPILGLVDTAVIGHIGDAVYLGAIAVGALILNFLYWGFGFLRMGTTGLTAQAYGAGDEAELATVLGRALVLGVSIGCALLILQAPLGNLAFTLMEGSAGVETLAQDYYRIRIWGAPATLMNYAIVGWFIGLQKTRWALAVQVWLNGVNIVLDIVFVVLLDWGVNGVALGTLLAELSTVALALILVARLSRSRSGRRLQFDWPRILDMTAMRRTLSVNADIFIRTLCLISAFAWFTAQGAKMGDVILAANFVLLQFFAFTAFFLDGFAFAAEALVGSAVGARARGQLNRSIRLSTHLAAGTAALLSLLIAFLGPWFIDALTNVPEVRRIAREYLPWVALNPIIAVWCFQLDGIFIGATRTADMRNMMIVSFAFYLAAWALLMPALGNHGLWAAFSLFFIVRGLTLGSKVPTLLRQSVPA